MATERTDLFRPDLRRIGSPGGWARRSNDGRHSELRRNGAFRRGYHPPPQSAVELRRATETSLTRSAGTALVDLALIGGSGGLAHVAGASLPLPARLLLGTVVVLVMARASRGLECLVHDASHHAWHRRRPRVNDLLADVIAALPMTLRTSKFRESHLRHHRDFGTDVDPDLRRYRELGLEDLPRDSFVRFTRTVLGALPTYMVGWFRSIGSDLATFLLSVLWHVAAFALVAVLATPALAVTIWAHWIVALVVVLPVVRLVGEAGEHLYEGSTTVFAATVSNLGPLHRLLFHPHNDGYHLAHHMWDTVPSYRLRRVHHMITRDDPTNYRRRFRWRQRVLGPTRQGRRGEQ